jgi:hypothetical protein
MMGPNRCCPDQRASWRTGELEEPPESRDRTGIVNFEILTFKLAILLKSYLTFK